MRGEGARKRVTISLPPKVHELAEKKAHAKYTDLAAYIRQLVIDDVTKKDDD